MRGKVACGSAGGRWKRTRISGHLARGRPVPHLVDRGPGRAARRRGSRPSAAPRGGFVTKPELGLAMLNRAYQAAVLTSCSWVTADEAYGQNPAFRSWLSDREIPFVLATGNDDLLASPDGHRCPAKVLATIAGVGEDGAAGGGWERRSIGPVDRHSG